MARSEDAGARAKTAKSRKRAAKQGAAAVEELSVEDALSRLEGLIEQLEDGELPLEDALQAFEEGVALSRVCGRRISEAEQRVEVLLGDGADGSRVPFSAEAEDLD